MNSTASVPVKVLVVATYVLMVTMNALANALPINGRNTGEISDSYANLFAPAGLTFSIWGVIYLLLAAHVLYQLGLFHPSGSGEDRSGRSVLLTQVGVLFALSSLANSIWILCWHYDLIGLSTLLLATMLVLLILITRMTLGARSVRDRIFVRLPFSVYFGWITVAMIANVTTWLVSIGWNGFGLAEATWTVAILAIGAAIGTAVIVLDGDIAYGLVLIWAYFGIWLKHTSASGFDGQYPSVVIAALICIAILVIAGGFVLARMFARRQTTSMSG